MIHLLNKSLVKSKATKADVKRVFALHLSLVAINLNSSSNEKVKEILLATAKSHLFLKCNEGIKLISFLVSNGFYPVRWHTLKQMFQIFPFHHIQVQKLSLRLINAQNKSTSPGTRF
jgi:hypothetical protein